MGIIYYNRCIRYLKIIKGEKKMEASGIVKIEMPDVDITYVGQTQRESLDSKALRDDDVPF